MATTLVSYARIAICVLLLAAESKASLPEPPEQHKPWIPSAGTVVPDYVVKVASRLFEIGLADPRGGDYRDVEVALHRDGKDTIRTHAWVFSSEHAVCWDGLVYRVRSAGGPANLDRDVAAIVRSGPWHGRTLSEYFAKWKAPPFWSALFRDQVMAPTSIALLLRLGRPDLAARIWRAPERNGRHESDEGLWLATAATAWFANGYWRLVGAFHCGDDEEAADVAESLMQWQTRVPADWFDAKNYVPRRAPDISFLKPVEALLADARRRLREPPRPRVDFQAIIEDPAKWAEFQQRPQAERVAELVERLDEARCIKASFPDPISCSFDPIDKLLMAEGDIGVDALCNAFQNDGRLTRDFDYSRPSSTSYTPISVRQAAMIVVNDIRDDLGLYRE